MKKHLFGLLLLSVSFFLSSAPLPPSVQNEIEKSQQQRLEAIKQQEQQLETLTPLPVLPESPVREDGSCFEIASIGYQGNTIFDNDELNQLINYKPQCLGLAGINEMLRKITNLYIENGYVTSRAYLTPQNLQSGHLNIVILEGRLEGVRWNGEFNHLLDFAFPFLNGRILNLRDIEQGLDQINRLQRYNAQIKLVPSQNQGYTIVEITTPEAAFLSSSLGVNNGGSTGTGETQLSASLSAENVLGGLESVSLSGSKSSEFSTKFDSESANLNIDLPLGYWNYTYLMTYSSYVNSFESNGFDISTDGHTNVYQLGSNWLFFRDSQTKAKLTTSVSHRRERNYLLGTKLDSSSRNLTHFSVGVEWSSRLGNAFVTAQPKYSKGTEWFNAMGDTGHSSSAPISKFDRADLTLSYTYPLSPQLRYSATLYGQWSNDTLYSNQRLSIGGEYSVRGFKNISLSGDEGYYWRNDLTYQIGQWPVVGQVSSVLALDTGTIKTDEQDELERGSLLGSSLTIRMAHRYYSSSVSIGVPIQHPNQLSADDYVVNYQIRFAI